MITNKHVLITGGAGFIGSHLADFLVRAGNHVRVLDSLHPQVHPKQERPTYLPREVELKVGDVRNADHVRAALTGIDVVVHLAARVGVGQSMYEIEDYTDTNNRGTAVLLECLSRQRVERLVVASSMSIYGEGRYRGLSADVDVTRSPEDLRRGIWEPRSPEGLPLEPLPTDEMKRPGLASVYALSKYDQERLCLIIGAAYGIPTVALRFFNVYGARQALSNPYTGVLAIFASRLLNERAPFVFEDGRQRRDFVHVSDVARACALALSAERAAGQVLNVGSGVSHTVMDVARALARVTGRGHIPPQVSGTYRAGDIRHCFADISLARSVLGFEPKVRLEDGLTELADWLCGQVAIDRVDEAREQLVARGLVS